MQWEILEKASVDGKQIIEGCDGLVLQRDSVWAENVRVFGIAHKTSKRKCEYLTIIERNIDIVPVKWYNIVKCNALIWIGG